MLCQMSSNNSEILAASRLFGPLPKSEFCPRIALFQYFDGSDAAIRSIFRNVPISGGSGASEPQIFNRLGPASLDAPHDIPQRAVYSTSGTLSPVSESNR